MKKRIPFLYQPKSAVLPKKLEIAPNKIHRKRSAVPFAYRFLQDRLKPDENPVP